MSNEVVGIKVSIDQIFNSDSPNVNNKNFIVPKKATILSGNNGTLVQDSNNEYFIVPVGLWFRSKFSSSNLPQVDVFDKLQDLGFTLIKDKIIRNDSKVVENISGQKIREQNNVSVKKVDKTVGTDIKSEEKNKDRSGTT